MKYKQLISIASLWALMLPNSWALRGGPWSHLQDENGINSNVGLYEGTITLEDGSGIFRFAVQSNQANLSDPIPSDPRDPLDDVVSLVEDNISNRIISERVNAQLSNTVVFVRGQVYYGTTYGQVDIPGRTVMGGSSGQSTVTEDLTAAIRGSAADIDAIVDVGGYSESFSMSFAAKINSVAPQVRFSGSGTLSLFSRPEVEISTTTLDGGNNNPDQVFITITNALNSQSSPQVTTQTTTTENREATTTTDVYDDNGNGPNIIGDVTTTTTTEETVTTTETTGGDESTAVRTNQPLEPDLEYTIQIMGSRTSLNGATTTTDT